MIKTLTAFTYEIDDVASAVEEIFEQLDMEHNLLAGSVGMVTCYAEFVDSGVVKALCDALPFDVVGTTTLGAAMGDEVSQLMLTLTVLTGDELQFATAVTTSLTEEQEKPMRVAYEAAAAKLPGKPSLIFSFLSLLFNVGGDLIVETLDEISGSVPNFGTIAVDHTPDYHDAQIIYNGEVYRESLAMVLVYGDIRPTFFIESISEEKILKQKAIITASQGNLLQEVNDMPVLDYMSTLGLTKNGEIEGANSIPFIVDFQDGTKPLARAIYATTPEGWAVCGGAMPVNAAFGVGSIDYEDVMSTTARMVDAALDTGKKGGMMLFSCISRNMALGMKTTDEMELVRGKAAGAVPYQFTYAGGEICPVYDENGALVNRFHNDTIVACVF